MSADTGPSRADTIAELRQERDYLVKILRGEWCYGERGAVTLGSSSFAMVARALLPRSFWSDEEPCDEYDLERCEDAYRKAPRHLKPLMLPTLKRFRALPRFAKLAAKGGAR